MDIAFITFVERFQIVFSEIYKHDITAGRPKLAAWIEVYKNILSNFLTRIDQWHDYA